MISAETFWIIIASAIVIILFVLIVILIRHMRRWPIVSGTESVIGKIGMIEKNGAHLWVRIEGERWQCQSRHPIIHDGQKVRVKKVKGLILLVEPIETGAKR